VIGSCVPPIDTYSGRWKPLARRDRTPSRLTCSAPPPIGRNIATKVYRLIGATPTHDRLLNLGAIDPG